jgi:molybdopterin-guanine dinucleotide biosynthesis protein A
MTSRGRSEPPAVSAIVLAGGRSSRFGSDKLRVEIDGRSLLELASEAASAVATELIVVLAPGDDRPLPASSVPVRRVADPESYGGPLVGLLAGLERAREPFVVAVGGDMPSVRPAILAALVAALAAAPAHVGAAVLSSQGRIVPLPAVLRTGSATDAVRRLVADGERRLRSTFDRLATRVLDEAEWRPLDPDAASLRDVDRPQDL